MESYIAKEGRGSVKITVSKKGCICCNCVDNNTCSSDFVLEDMLERGTRTIIMCLRLIRSVGGTNT